MNLIEGITGWLESTTFYQDHMKNWAAPLNDPSFDIAFLFFAVMIILLPEVFDVIRVSVRRSVKKREMGRAEGIPMREEVPEPDAFSAIEPDPVPEDEEPMRKEEDLKEIEPKEEEKTDLPSLEEPEENDPEEDEYARIMRDIRKVRLDKAEQEEIERQREEQFLENAKESSLQLSKMLLGE